MEKDERLFKVRVSTELMVLAKTEEEAVGTAIEIAPREIKTYPQTEVARVFNSDEIPEPWPQAVPYRGGKRTVLAETCNTLVEKIVSQYPNEAESHSRARQEQKVKNEAAVTILNEQRAGIKKVPIIIKPPEAPQPGRPMPPMNFERPKEEI